MTHEQKTQALALIRDGDLSNRKIAQIVGVDEKSVRRWKRAIRRELRPTVTPGEDTAEAVHALVDGVLRARSHVATARESSIASAPSIPLMQQIVIADPHLSKLCWPGTTGGESYDIATARRLVLGGVKYLVRQQPHVTQRTIAFLGDYFHYDTLSGTTTAGTLQDRDSRLPKMLEVGADVAFQAVLHASLHGSVHVVLVPGNHDAVLTTALQRILQAEFRSTPHVTIDGGHTKRKTHVFGRNLFLYDHGDRRKKELPHTLAVEHPALWGASLHREIHTGHLHTEGATAYGTVTMHGCTVYTHPSMSPPDQWHADEQYVGSPRGMKSYTYLESGGQIASHMVTPSLLMPT